jgi:hypothetical protein
MRENHYEREATFLTNYFILIIMSLCPTLFPFMFSIPNFTKLFFSSFKLFLWYNLFYFSKSFAKSIPSSITSLTSPLNIHLIYTNSSPIHLHFSHLNTMGVFIWLKGEPKSVDFAWFLG